jgi:glycosyltransferase involved in cell wall biosynthesis/intein/homing endonuclease
MQNKGIRGIGKHDAYILAVGGDNLNILREYGFDIEYSDTVSHKLNVFTKDNYIAFGINKIEEYNYSGFVYNLEVEEDNSYSVNQFFVHNCTLDADEIFEEPLVFKMIKDLINPPNPQTMLYAFPLLHCFVAGQPVITEKGFKSIENITISDSVLTHTGNMRKVKEIISSNYIGKVYKIYIRGSNIPLICTPEHKIYVKDNIWNCPKWVEAQNLSSSNKLIAKYPYLFKERHILFDSFINEHVSTKNNRFKFFKKHKMLKLKLDNGLARLVGYYLAEGYSHKSNIIFSFHKNERKYHKDVISLMNKYFGLKPHFYKPKKGNGVQIIFSDKWLVRCFQNLFGCNAYNKHIPDEFFTAKSDIRFNLFLGWYYGDGYKAKESRKIKSVGFDLAYGMSSILTSIGIRNSFYKEYVNLKKCNNQVYSVTIYDSDYKIDLSGKPIEYSISRIETDKYNGKVYNLHVDCDNSYTIYGKVVHNCWNDENHYRADGLWGKFIQSRLFRNLPGQHIETSGDGTSLSGCTPWFSPFNTKLIFLRIKHYGNMEPEVRKVKYDFYAKLYKDKGPSPLALGKWEPYYKKMYKKEKLDPEDYARHIIDETNMHRCAWSPAVSISLNVVTKNNETEISQLLSLMAPIVNEIVIVDTGSVDKTIQICESFGAKIIRTEWKHDYSHPRNLAIDNSTKDWILRIDPDEFINGADLLDTWLLACAGDMDAYIFPVKNYLQDPRKDENAKWFHSQSIRMFRRIPGIHYKGLVHEEIDKSLKELNRKTTIGFANIYYHHFGYLNTKEYLEKKFDYYYKLCLKQLELDPDNFYPYHSIGVHMKHIGKFDEARRYFDESLKREPRAFLSLAGLAEMAETEENFDLAAEYYQKALEVKNPLRTDRLSLGFRKKLFEMKAKKSIKGIQEEEKKYLEGLQNGTEGKPSDLPEHQS